MGMYPGTYLHTEYWQRKPPYGVLASSSLFHSKEGGHGSALVGKKRRTDRRKKGGCASDSDLQRDLFSSRQRLSAATGRLYDVRCMTRLILRTFTPTRYPYRVPKVVESRYSVPNLGTYPQMDNLERFGGRASSLFRPMYFRGAGPKWAELWAQSLGSEKRSCHFRTRLRGAGLAGCLAMLACYVAKLQLG